MMEKDLMLIFAAAAAAAADHEQLDGQLTKYFLWDALASWVVLFNYITASPSRSSYHQLACVWQANGKFATKKKIWVVST